MVSEDETDLQGFIKSTLVQIIRGVGDAIAEIGTPDSGAVINPSQPHSNYANPTEVSFDVAVTVTEGKSGSGSGRIKVAGIDLGGGKDKTSATEAVSRIRFSVPVAVPSSRVKQYQIQPPLPTGSGKNDWV